MTEKTKIARAIRAWIWASCICAAIIGVSLAASPFVQSPGANDPWGLCRYLVLRLAAAAWGIIALTGSVLFFDYVTPGDWFAKIEEGNIACAVVTAGVVFTIGLVLCYV